MPDVVCDMSDVVHLVRGHAQAQRTVARLVMAHMPPALFYDELAGRRAEAQHAHLV